jgi:urease accessory protein
MSPPATLLRLMWLASPALPVGGFGYSEGLEAAVDAGHVRDEATAADWLADQLELVLARADLPVLAAAVRAWSARAPSAPPFGDLGDPGAAESTRAAAIERPAPRDAAVATPAETPAALNDWVRITRETAELRLQSEQMGRSLAEWLRQGEHAGDPHIDTLGRLAPAPTWPVAFGLAAALAGAAPREALLAFGFSWAENMVQAAIKAVPLGQTAAQRILARLVNAMPRAVDAALLRPRDDWQAFAPGLAILSSRHETQYSRLFRS